MKYTVSVAIDGRIDVNVEADSFEDAKSKISLIDIDLRNMECVGFRAVNAEDENGVFVPNLRINLPKSWESTGEKLYELVDMILADDIGVVVCEDLMGRYNLNYKDSYEDLLYGMGAKLLRSDGHNFFTFEWKGKEFGLFGYHGDKNASADTEEAGYEKTDIIIAPNCHSDERYSHKVYSVWEDYCHDIGNHDLA